VAARPDTSAAEMPTPAPFSDSLPAIELTTVTSRPSSAYTVP